MIIFEGKENTSSAVTLRTILDIEKIPYLFADGVSIPNGKVLEGYARLCINYQKSKYEDKSPAIFIGGLNSEVAKNIFGVSNIKVQKTAFSEIKINPDFLTPAHRPVFFKHNKTGLVKLPCFEIHTVDINPGFEKIEILARFNNVNSPAIIKKDNLIWCLFDIGETFNNLINERYIDEAGQPQKKRQKSLLSFTFMQKFYYRVSAPIRILIQRIFALYLNTKLNREKKNKLRTDFPIDISGWALIQFLRSMIFKLNGKIIDIAKMPKGYKSCFVFTHDIEPTKFAYTEGLPALLNHLGNNSKAHSIDLVAMWADKYSRDLKPVLKKYDINCHGLYHDDKTLVLSPEELNRRIKQAKDILEDVFELEISGYRSPRMNRSLSLIRAIEEAGYKYSSMSVDTDRENVHFFGKGVSINYPYRPIICDKDKFRSVNFFEFPVTAPDCIMPLFMGCSQEEMFQMYREKIDYTHDCEGVFVCINHAGVFDKKDIRIRARLLDFLLSLLKDKKDIWQTNMNGIYKWWAARENIRFIYSDTGIKIRNDNKEPVSDIRINIDTENGKKELIVPTINPQESIELEI